MAEPLDEQRLRKLWTATKLDIYVYKAQAWKGFTDFFYENNQIAYVILKLCCL